MRFAGLRLANLLRRFDEVRQFRPGVVRRDATTSVTEQVLAILKAHAFWQGFHGIDRLLQGPPREYD